MIARVLLTFLFIMSVSPAYAVVDWDEGFEYANIQALIDGPWQSSCSAAGHVNLLDISTTRVHSGSKSIKLTYTGTGPNPPSCFIDRNLTTITSELYTRYWAFIETGFTTVGGVPTKSQFQGRGLATYPSFWWGFFAPLSLGVTEQGVTLPNGTTASVNRVSGSVPTNQWVCIETHVKMSDPGVSNGIVQSWVNGQLQVNFTSEPMTPAVTNVPYRSDAKMDFVRFYVQHGAGVIYYDDAAVDRSARIGCGSTPPPPPTDTTPPTAPTLTSVQ